MMKTPQQVKKYLKAKRPEGLTMLMLQNNSKRSSYHEYQIIYADGYWYAWYNVEIDEVINEKAKEIESK